jgi:hypothetical protein
MKQLSAIPFLLAILGIAEMAHGFIDPKFTPVNLVKESKVILVGTLIAGANGTAWKITASETLKGEAAGPVIALVTSEDDASKSVGAILSSNGDRPVILFISRDGKSASLDVSGQWLKLTLPGEGLWRVELARQMSGVWAGGTDMLIRLSRYLLAEPKATVPVSVAVSWMRDKWLLGKVDGNLAGMQEIELGGEHRPCVCVAADKGDKLYCAKENDESFEDVTAQAGLDSRSRQFTWMDLVGSGDLQLVSWSGAGVQVRQVQAGKLKVVGKEYPFAGECLGLSPCALRAGGEPAVLVSTTESAFLLHLDRRGTWATSALPAGCWYARVGR